MMRSHSSISNSRATKAFWIAVCFVVAFWALDAVLRRTELYRYSVGNRLGDVVRVVQRQVKEHKKIVAFIGTSRMHSAIDPDEIGKSLEGAKCLNLSINSMQFWEILKALRLTQVTGGEMPIMVMEIAPFMFNENCKNPATGLPFDNTMQLELWADFQDVWHQGNLARQARLVKKMMTGPIRLEELSALARKGAPEAPRPVYFVNRELEARMANRRGFSAEEAAEAHGNEFVISEYAEFCFGQIVQYCGEHGIRLILLELPNRPAYAKTMEAKMGAENLRRYEALLDNAKCQRISLNGTADIGLDDTVFVDYGHFNYDGCLKFTRKLGAMLR